MKVLALDAMGVIYSVGDDVTDLLCPFVKEKSGTGDASQIADLYHSASLGEMSASEFWREVGLDSRLEDEYLQRHKLTDGLIDFLEAANALGWEIWCLSNDLSQWSRKLRARFGLDKYFRGFIISGDVGVRKPGREIFDYLVEQLEASPSCMVFVDDQRKNLDMAAALGSDTILFAPTSHGLADEKHRVATTFGELLLMLSEALTV